MGFDFAVEYHAGKQNKVADILSRRFKGPTQSCFTLNALFTLFYSICTEIQNSDQLQLLKQNIQQGQVIGPWQYKDDLLFFLSDEFNCYMILLLFNLLSWLSIIVAMRDIIKTLHRVAQDFYWQGMKTSIQAFVRQRLACQEHKTEHLHSTGLLQPLPVSLQI
jgi:hypothetical protein